VKLKAILFVHGLHYIIVYMIYQTMVREKKQGQYL